MLLGSLSKEEIRKVVATSTPRIRACYERALDRAPELTGKLRLTWEIDKNGSIGSARVRETTMMPPDATFEACVLDVVRRMRFAAPRGGGRVVVTYPFVFSSSPAPQPAAHEHAGLIALAVFGAAVGILAGVATVWLALTGGPTVTPS